MHARTKRVRNLSDNVYFLSFSKNLILVQGHHTILFSGTFKLELSVYYIYLTIIFQKNNLNNL